MKKFTKTKAKGKVGVTFVQDIVFKEGSIFREVSEETDLGIDGYIEFIENEFAIGVIVGVQIKCGYFNEGKTGQYFKIPFSKNDLNYCNILRMPVALIAYDPKTNFSAWLDLKKYIQSNPKSLKKKKTIIYLSNTESPFTLESFRGDFKPAFQDYQLIPSQLKFNLQADSSKINPFYLDGALLNFASQVASNEVKDKFEGLVGLLSYEKLRFSPYTCFLLITHLFHQDETIRNLATDALSRYLAHPEVGFDPPKQIRDSVYTALAEFKQTQVRELLKTALNDEGGSFERGTLSQSAGVIIINIPKYEEYLYQLTIDPAESYEVRCAAIALPLEFGFFHVLRPVVSNFDQIDWGMFSRLPKQP